MCASSACRRRQPRLMIGWPINHRSAPLMEAANTRAFQHITYFACLPIAIRSHRKERNQKKRLSDLFIYICGHLTSIGELLIERRNDRPCSDHHLTDVTNSDHPSRYGCRLRKNPFVNAAQGNDNMGRSIVGRLATMCPTNH